MLKICFMFSFVGTKFCLQLNVLVVCKLYDDVCNFEKEKTMFAIHIHISK
jgi:hypothetical protein